MTRISSTFRRLGKTGEVAAIPYLPIGLPDVQMSRSLLPVIGRQGADLIAFGTLLALPRLNGSLSIEHTGARLDDCLSIAAEARRTNEVPLVLVSTLADAQVYGLDELVSTCARCGVDGLFLPDLPFEHFATFAETCGSAGVDTIPSILPAVRFLVPLASAGGFVYCPVHDPSGFDVESLHARISDVIDLPIVAGVAAERPGELPIDLAYADGILAESGIAPLLTSHPPDEIMLEVSDYVRALKEACTRPE